MAQPIEHGTAPPTAWGARAAGVYTEPYAERYRAHDQRAREGPAVAHLAARLRAIWRRRRPEAMIIFFAMFVHLRVFVIA